MAVQYKRDPENFDLFTSEDYIDFMSDFIGFLRPDISIERFVSEAPYDLLIAPKWNQMKNFEVVAKIDQKLAEKNTCQGKYYKG